MATIALAAIPIAAGLEGTALTVAAAAATAVGAYIDRTLVFPTLFGQDHLVGPRIESLEIQHHDEGAPVNHLIGTAVRTAGTVIWVSDLIEIETGSGGGKKSGGGVRGYDYYVDIAVSIGGPIVQVDRVWADGKIIYIESPDQQVITNQVSVTVQSISSLLVDINSPAGGPDLGVFQSGYDIIISGFATGGNNGTFRVIAATRNLDGSSRLRIQNPTGFQANESAGATVTLTQDLPQFNPAKLTNITFHDGSASQDPDSLIEAYEGAGNVPAWRGKSYVVIEKLNLRDYGFRIPQFSFLATAQASATQKTAMANILARGDVVSGDYDLTQVTARDLRGYVISGPSETVKSLQPLMLAFDVLEQERDNVVHFFDRTKATIVEIPVERLGAFFSGEDAPRPVMVDRPEDVQLPSEVDVGYVDYEIDTQRASQRARRRDAAIDAIMSVDLPIVMDATQARGIADRLLWLAWANAETVSGTLPPEYLFVRENDVIRFQAFGAIWDILLKNVDQGANYLIRWEGHVEIREVLTQREIGESPLGGLPSVQFTLQHHIEPIIINPPTTTTPIPGENPAVVVGVTAPDPGPQWTGAQVFLSKDDTTFELAGSLPTEATFGLAESILGVAVPGYWDFEKSVDVFIHHGALESKTEIEVLNGGNLALIGNEVIAFRTATLLSEGRYRLSGLLRGLRNTEDHVSGHAAGDVFALLSGVGFISVDIADGDVGVLHYYRAVPAGGSVDDAASKSFTPTAENIKPFGPTHLSQLRDAPSSDDVTISWVRRSRALTRFFALGPAPILEPFETYEVDLIYPSGSGTVVRTKTVTGAQSTVYTAAEQTADSVTLGAAFDVRVYQMSDRIGRGNSSDLFTVEGT